ncbi:signal peptidase II [Geodermatophilus amargosae]|uniref:Lipoprotein signal peptidase n=1 Tax=Geodermatophilus amargosae TaxID=1296565 RepID=A0A1I7ASN5_9ACTN|nr:signal peptidase II [Geodermatophilus amargosae]SFT77917.1 signal peptidase II [Geodermatophilus amargosae]
MPHRRDGATAARRPGEHGGRGYRRLVGRPTSGRPETTASTRSPPLSEQPEDAGDDGAAAAAAPVRRARTRLLALLAVTVFLADLGSKLLVVATVDRGENIRLLGGLLHLTHARNTGAAFSFAEGFTVVFTLIAAVVVVVIVRTARRLFSTGWAVALGLVLGGAVGNLVDRVFRDPGFLRGGVVDFVSVFAPNGEVYPIFNVADSAIVCGGLLGAVLALRGIEFDGSRARDRGDDAVSRG